VIALIVRSREETGMDVRELRKAARRRAILEAARVMIRDDESHDFTMPGLAEKAGVSLATPYNLFGSKSSILLEIVRADIFGQIADLGPSAGTSLADWVAGLARSLAGVYYPNRHFYRRMIVTLVAQESAESQKAALDFSYRLFEGPLKRLQDRGTLSSAVPAAILAQHLAHGISGSLQHRLMQRGTQDLLCQELEMAALLILAGVAADDERPAMLDRMRSLAAGSTRFL
jgi:AcrR family transcriptional regulator